MMNMANKEKMFECMLDLCGKSMSAEEKSKWKGQIEACFNTMATLKPGFMEMSRDMRTGIMSCCKQMDFSACMPSCCAGTDKEKKHG